MTDYATFKHGSVTYPLPAATTNSLLQDADPALYYALDYIAAVLHIHIGARLAAQATVEGFTIANAVAQKIHSEPSPFLFSDQFVFPTLAIYRKTEAVLERTVAWEKDTAEWEFAYILPPFTPRQVDQIAPILRAAARVISQAVTQGWHPSYNGGAKIWQLANIEMARVTSIKYGGYDQISEIPNYYRAIVGTIEVIERDDVPTGAFELFDGVDYAQDFKASDATSIVDMVLAQTNVAPTVTSLSITTGTKAGGTTTVLTGTGFRVGTQPLVTFGGAYADNVVVLSATQISAKTPPHDAYPTFAADVVVINADGQRSTPLVGAFTFN